MRCQASRVVQLERATAVIACPSCGFEAPDDFAFCPKCATALVAPRACLGGAQGRHHALLRPRRLHGDERGRRPRGRRPPARRLRRRARRVIESHGGVVEKFIGDAVVGVFGVPAVREDDPERAVRPALHLLQALEGMTRPDGSPLQARCGVNTGEALVRLDVDPSSGDAASSPATPSTRPPASRRPRHRWASSSAP